MRGCVRACAVEIKLGELHDACFDDVRVWTHIRFALQDGDFNSKTGVIQYGLIRPRKKLMAPTTVALVPCAFDCGALCTVPIQI